MKKLLKLAAVGLAAVLTAVSLSACGADTAKLSLVKEGTLIMGTNAEFPPFEYKEGTGFAGIDVDIMKAIAENCGPGTPSGAISFSLPISAVAGLRVLEDD